LATVGQLAVNPGASNVIPGWVSLSLDVRHPDDRARIKAVAALRAEAEAVADRRGVAMEWTSAQCGPTVPCSPRLVAHLARAIEDAGYRVRHLTSGAGHDAVPMASLSDVAMLFVRCRGGISHNPAESIRERDVEVALETLYRFVIGLASDPAIHVSSKEH
jgi:acetylornithine deacetylase/succinyl-diaminopimelate desuccinylase-like protein